MQFVTCHSLQWLLIAFRNKSMLSLVSKVPIRSQFPFHLHLPTFPQDTRKLALLPTGTSAVSLFSVLLTPVSLLKLPFTSSHPSKSIWNAVSCRKSFLVPQSGLWTLPPISTTHIFIASLLRSLPYSVPPTGPSFGFCFIPPWNTVLSFIPTKASCSARKIPAEVSWIWRELTQPWFHSDSSLSCPVDRADVRWHN